MHFSITFVQYFFLSFLCPFVRSYVLLLFIILYFSVSTWNLLRLLVDYKSCVYVVAIRSLTHTHRGTLRGPKSGNGNIIVYYAAK